jgi:tetratricopeptide (TPR) repeat protein
VKRLVLLFTLLLLTLATSAQSTSVSCADDLQPVTYDLYRAGVARGRGDNEEALAYLECVLNATPNDPLALRLRGSINLDLGNLQTAINDFNRVLELNPNDVIAFNNRGFAAYQFKWYDLALKDYNRAIELDPTYARAYNNRGMVYSALGNYSEALTEYRRAIDLNYEPSLDPRWNIVMVHKEVSPSNDLIAALNEVMTTNPDFPLAYRVMGETLIEMGRERDAQAYFDEYTRLTDDELDEDGNTIVYNYQEDPARVILQYTPGLLIVLIVSGMAGGALIELRRRRQVVA